MRNLLVILSLFTLPAFAIGQGTTLKLWQVDPSNGANGQIPQLVNGEWTPVDPGAASSDGKVDSVSLSGDTLIVYQSNALPPIKTILESISGSDTYVTGALFSVGTGILTLSGTAGDDVTVDLDGRYVVEESQELSLIDNVLTITNGDNEIGLLPYLDNTDNQILSLSNNLLSISGGNAINLPITGTGYEVISSPTATQVLDCESLNSKTFILDARSMDTILIEPRNMKIGGTYLITFKNSGLRIRWPDETRTFDKDQVVDTFRIEEEYSFILDSVDFDMPGYRVNMPESIPLNEIGSPTGNTDFDLSGLYEFRIKNSTSISFTGSETAQFGGLHNSTTELRGQVGRVVIDSTINKILIETILTGHTIELKADTVRLTGYNATTQMRSTDRSASMNAVFDNFSLLRIRMNSNSSLTFNDAFGYEPGQVKTVVFTGSSGGCVINFNNSKFKEWGGGSTINQIDLGGDGGLTMTIIDDNEIWVKAVE
jgi:hypothetical protein